MTEKRLVLGKEMLQIVKALANQSRFTILTQLYDEALTFQKLKDVTNLEKSALANNLHKLLDVGLVEKTQHGIYAITDDGKKLLESLQHFIEASNERRRRIEIANAQRQMMKPFLERHKTKTKE